MKTGLMVAAAVAALGFSGATLADAAAGKAKWDADCADCHEVSEYAGTPAADMQKTLKGILAGTVKHKSKLKMTDAEIAALAAFLEAAK